MHELSIAIGIVDMATEEALRHGADRVNAVHLRLGRLSGIVPRALEAAYGLACEETPLEGSRLLIEDVPVVIYCASCQTKTEIASIESLTCSRCGAASSELVQGREIEVVALELPE